MKKSNTEISINQLADLAQEIESQDPIEWEDLSINELTAYRLMASHVIEMSDDPLTLKATIVKLLVENFITNLKLEKNYGSSI